MLKQNLSERFVEYMLYIVRMHPYTVGIKKNLTKEQIRHQLQYLLIYVYLPLHQTFLITLLVLLPIILLFEYLLLLRCYSLIQSRIFTSFQVFNKDNLSTFTVNHAPGSK